MICAPATLEMWMDEDKAEYCIIDIPYECSKKKGVDVAGEEKSEFKVWSLIYKIINNKK